MRDNCIIRQINPAIGLPIVKNVNQGSSRDNIRRIAFSIEIQMSLYITLVVASIQSLDTAFEHYLFVLLLVNLKLSFL